MTLKHCCGVAISLVLVSISTASAQTHPQDSLAARGRRLVGTWRIVRYCDRDSTGAMVEPLGPHPTGLFIYTPTGELSIQAMRMPASGPLTGEPVRLTSLGELRPFYFGYFGTYSILSDTTVIHHVKGGTFPDYIGTDQARQYRIRGDTLSIGAPLFPCRVLIRIK
jgi:lipocalin-like protein